MTEANEQQSSIRSLFEEADMLRVELCSYPNSNSDEYQNKLRSAVTKYEQCKDLIGRASMFSINESLEDLATSDMRCLIIPFNIAELSMKVKSSDRKAVLQRSMALYKEYIALCDTYDLVSSVEKSAADNAGTGRSVSALPSDPGERRTAKIAQFKIEKELRSKIESLSNYLNADEEDLRSFHKASLKLAIMQTIQALEMIVLELDMLSKAPPPSEGPPEKRDEDDIRTDRPKNDGYSERLDTIPSSIIGGALLSKDGKPLRPFTLIDKRRQVRDGVFGPGHNLPTMTIDEYLEEERRMGGIIEGGGEKSGERPEPNEDDYEQTDRDTIKARQWDEYIEENPKGSGNTLNRG